MNNNFLIALWKGVRHFGISIGVLILGGIIQALGNFHPEPGAQSLFWTAVGAAVIGGITTFMNWLKNKDSVTSVQKTSDATITTTVKPKV